MALSPIAQSLIRDAARSWNYGSHQPDVVTYSFAATSAGFWNSDYPSAVAQPFSQQQQASIRAAINTWGDVSGLTLVEVPDDAADRVVDIRFRMADIPVIWHVYSPYDSGDISLDTTQYGSDTLAPGSNGYSVLLMTIGYALGLNSAASSMTNDTVMAKVSASTPAVTSLRAADVEAIQYVYGTPQDQDAFHIHWSWDADNQGLRHDGNDTSQRINGTEGRDIILGYGGDDRLNGFRGDDLLVAGPGNNTVWGGDGFDTLGVNLFRTEASLRATSSEGGDVDLGGIHLSAYGTVTGAGETTRFENIESIAFTDGRLVFGDTDPAAQVTRLYQAVLGRAPDPIGQENWTTALQQGAPLSALAEGFMGSDEFRARFGTPDDAGFVTMAYRQALGREPDAAGAAFWLDHLAHGMSRAEMLVGFSESDENRALTKPLLAQGIWDVDDQMADIARLYQAVLGRAPDRAGLLFWDNLADGGITIPQMANLFAQSQEFGTRFPGATDQAFVQMVYQNTLGRTGEAAGEAFWLDHLAHGMTRGELVAGFADSTEFLVNSTGLTERGIIFA